MSTGEGVANSIVNKIEISAIRILYFLAGSIMYFLVLYGGISI